MAAGDQGPGEAEKDGGKEEEAADFGQRRDGEARRRRADETGGAIGEAAPLLLLGIGAIRFDPNGFFSQVTALPIQIYRMSSQSQAELQQAASAGIIVLLVMVLGLNAVAIFIRNKFQRSW